MVRLETVELALRFGSVRFAPDRFKAVRFEALLVWPLLRFGSEPVGSVRSDRFGGLLDFHISHARLHHLLIVYYVALASSSAYSVASDSRIQVQRMR